MAGGSPSLLGALVCLLLLQCLAYQAEGCTGRHVINTTQGMVTDGVGKEYPESAHCEWLIDAGGNGKSIQLVFVSMATECSYDYLFIYDGNSYHSKLIGSYSGNTVPDTVLAKSGYMLIYLFSDRNYVRNGFVAKFNVTDCPWNCSQQGVCNPVSHMCTCNNGFTGEGCEVALCPENCGEHGICDMSTFKCTCDTGYAGSGCTLSTNISRGHSAWFSISPVGTGFAPRTGHAGAFVQETNSFYAFGGFDLNNYFDDLVQYDFAQNEWKVLEKTLLWPAARHGHAMVEYLQKLYMFGGIISDGTHSNELWVFNVATGFWTLVDPSGKPAGLSSHTLTLVEDTWLYLFGGRTHHGDFSSSIYRVHLQDMSAWQEVIPRSGKIADRRLIGHSTVYHPESKSLLVFGGFQPDYARFPKRTNALHAFHVEENVWSQIHYDTMGEVDLPKQRAFHTATIMGNYMVVYGGNAHIHHQEEICYDNQLYFYHLGCHIWINYKELGKGKMADLKGRFSHVAIPAFGNTLLISGGYRGNVLGDFLAYTLPLQIAKNQNDPAWKESSDHCPLHKDYTMCKVDPECVWCMERGSPTTPGCVARTKAQECNQEKEIRMSMCPGICPALVNCSSCTVMGQGAQPGENSTKGLWQNEQCAWCVKDAKCQKKEELLGTCNILEGTTSGIDGWWGKNSSRLTAIDQCRNEDYSAGLHLIKYRPPADYSHPDEVEIVRVTQTNFMFDSWVEKEDLSGKKYIASFKGFLHPLGSPSSNGAPLKVFIVSAAAHSRLNISTDENPDNSETVAELELQQYNTIVARRPRGGPIFPQEARGYKYYMEQEAFQDIAGPKHTQVGSIIQLEWTGGPRVSSTIRQTLTSEFLEPYNGGVCSEYGNCMMCMTDTSCGWCTLSSQCLDRADKGLPAVQCGASAGAQHLVMDADQCPLCADHLACSNCTNDPQCEWLPSEVKCFRRGRFVNATHDVQSCPVPCIDRSNCSWCVSEQNECAWCEQTKTCFPFVEYIMRFSYGGCTQWIDSMSLQKCHDCSRHLTCKACQAEYQCGWCGSDDNPTIGVCLHGDFTGPDTSSNCSALVSVVGNMSQSENASWSYGVCPDVHECRLGLHDCHENATCINTFDSFVCKCNRGFTGDGKLTCDRTCFYDCVHGHCSGAPEYQCICDIGWMGEECNTNCGCNNHSTCKQGIMMCDKCQDWTTGTYCELCKAGSYGNATTPAGCTACNCNGHGGEDQGICNSTTGECYCRDNTEGEHCDRCKEGYYGNPENGQKCYLKCAGRSILGNVTVGALGSHQGRGVERKSHAYCLWILTVHPDLNNLRLLDVVPSITFTMETDIKTECSRDYVYVYDGIPGFMISNGASTSATLLATYCGHTLREPLSVEAKSGYLTVYFEGSIDDTSSTRGFNASFRTNACPGLCVGNRVCDNNRCVCKDGYGGVDCSMELCPENCSALLSQGRCELTLGQCVCRPGYAGTGCQFKLPDNAVVYTTLFDPQGTIPPKSVNSTISRMGHTLVTCDESSLYMFGGYSLASGALGDLWRFDIAGREWSEVLAATSDRPSPRYFHAAVCVPAVHAMYVFGGLLSDTGRATDELWKFSIDSNRWSKLEITEVKDGHIPPMAGHSMTLLGEDGTKIGIIGGFSSENYYSNSTFEYDVGENSWSAVKALGVQPVGLYGHSAVFHKQSNAIYVFGGMEYQTDHSVPSSNLYAFDLKKNMWNILQSEAGNRPLDRYFHSAVTTDSYMVVIGGAAKQRDFDHTVMAYRYACNKWMDLTPPAPNIYGEGIPAVMGQSAVMATSEIYIFGGFGSVSHGDMVKMTLPLDLCTLQTEVHACLNSSGCAVCTVQETNKTFCYAKHLATRPAGCLVENTTISIQDGVSCDRSRVEDERFCEQQETCATCLAQWPAHRGHDRNCMWCSNCPQGKCIPKTKQCKTENPCTRQQRDMTSVGVCVTLMCLASDCEKCGAKEVCIWTRQFKRSSEVGRTLSLTPMYDWNCVAMTLLEATPYKLKITSYPPGICPRRCYEYTTCDSCLESLGSEGGNQECEWSALLQQCMPPAYRTLRCSNGECGHMLVRSHTAPHSMQCPQTCSIHSQCSKCLETPGCGWCSLGPVAGLDGLGVCMEGGLAGPLHGMCTMHNVTLGNEPLSEQVQNWTAQAFLPPVWNFGKCPPENECLNDHHTCKKNEDCTNLEEEFTCNCKSGFHRGDSSGDCRPVCRQGCAPHGTCVHPDVCQCHFSYVGHNCSTECKCNKHSDCESVEKRDNCTQCLNDTQGTMCQECKALFVGDPREGGTCVSCIEFCNKHSQICLEKVLYNSSMSLAVPLPLDPSNISVWLKRGPTNPAATVCIKCQGNTEGDRCEDCKTGFFRLDKQPKHSDCTPCECNGHSAVCDKDKGTNCDCKNNTKSPHCDPKTKKESNKKPCWEQECSQCVENFLGTPTQGHQCYRQMTVDREYCLDPTTQMNCHRDSRMALLRGRTVFFAIQPKYLNVDIRMILDITVGGVDVFFSPHFDTFNVSVDSHTGIHRIDFDNKYQFIDGKFFTHRARRAAVASDGTSDNSSTPEDEKTVYHMFEKEAKDFNIFITLSQPNTILMVRGVRDRLVITLPNTIHDLQTSRFFMVLKGVGESDSNETSGLLFFRQDQPHIDLFVFFSVFFSCFFLFLAICVMLWKLKQAFDARISRHQRLLEMEHMASRPFAKTLVLIGHTKDLTESESEGDEAAQPPQAKAKLPGGMSKYSLTSISPSASQPNSPSSEEPFHINPLALEPTDDGIAAVGTFIFQLPGSSNAPVQVCLASSLITMRVMYPHPHVHMAKTYNLRRQPSSTA